LTRSPVGYGRWIEIRRPGLNGAKAAGDDMWERRSLPGGGGGSLEQSASSAVGHRAGRGKAEEGEEAMANSPKGLDATMVRRRGLTARGGGRRRRWSWDGKRKRLRGL